MNFKDLDDVLEKKDLQKARLLLREFDDLTSAQTRQPVQAPGEHRRIGQLLAAQTRALATAIDGEDNRRDVVDLLRPEAAQLQVASISVRDNVRAVALLAHRDLLTGDDGRQKLTTLRLGDVQELCSGERFFEYPVATPATAFLVQQDLVVTLRHNLAFFGDLESIRVVFEFALGISQEPASCKLDFSHEEIFEVTEVYSLVDDGPNAFVALRLSRPVTDRAPVVCNFGAPIGAKEPVYMIGHPLGLPKIYADAAIVLDASSAEAFTASLDAFAGNSASPVFNAKTGHVEGILAEGGDDFQWTENEDGGFCNYSIVYEESAPFGYKVVRIQKLQRLLGI